MNKKLVLIFVLLLIISVSGCINSSIDNANQVIPDISSAISNGDSNYNEAVDLVNNERYDEALDMANQASLNFNNSLTNLLNIKENNTDDLDKVYQEYINYTYYEVELKFNATNELIYSIQAYKEDNIEIGNDYSSQANYLMNRAVDYQEMRVEVANNNHNMFKNG